MSKKPAVAPKKVVPEAKNQLVDAIIAWGDLNAIRNRIREHHAAGADHVCIQVLTADPHALPLREWRELASALL